MYKLCVESDFSAAHRLVNYPGACQRLHGHNWKIKATVAAEELNELGMVIDLYELKQKLDDCLCQFDHRVLNEVQPFDKINPTSENLAKYIYEYYEKQLPENVNLFQIELFETEKFSVIYSKI